MAEEIDNHKDQTINALRSQNAALIRALRGFIQDVETDYKDGEVWLDQPSSLVKGNYENCKQVLEQCGFYEK